MGRSTSALRAAAAITVAVLMAACAAEEPEGPMGFSNERPRPSPTASDWSMPPTTTTEAPTTTVPPPPTPSPTAGASDSELAFFTDLELHDDATAAQAQGLLQAGYDMCGSADGFLDVLHDLDPSPAPSTQADWVGGALQRAIEEGSAANAARYGGYAEAYRFFATLTASAGRHLCPQHALAVSQAFPGM